MLVTVLHTFPFVYLLAASALQSVDASMEESARILGAGRWRTAHGDHRCRWWRRRSWPGALVAFVNAIALFGSQAIIGLPGRIFTLPTRIYALFDYPPRYGLASALSLVFVAITVVALALQRRYLARRSYVTVGGKGHRPQSLALGAARWGVLAFCVAVFVMAVLAPYLTLLAVSVSRSWGLDVLAEPDARALSLRPLRVRRHAPGDREQPRAGRRDRDAHRAARQPHRLERSPDALPGRKLLDYVSLVPLGLPGIVMAVALIQFWLRVPVPIYGTLLIILLAYSARYVPLAVRSANAAFRQVDPSLEETARMTGAGWLRTFGDVTLPLARPGLFAGGCSSSCRPSRS